ncbi:hypothetical protein [Hyalangium gracile]|uniref:hypothetical protein n=1 Tax=Hyalangium gracile TaxID=394092 RepID=UPI001CD03DEC|nr:hypothetical protein [Hyalangium gracile]
MIQDPAGLLRRIPELKPLCEDPGVRVAVERGDPFRLYRALRWARWLGRLRSHRELIDSLLAQRRLFVRPIKSNPWLGTVNGFGATLLGSAEPDSHDGTHIATHYVVALFAIPLLPLGAYVVRPAEGGNMMSRGWSLFARVPLGLLPWLYSRTLALGVMALVVLGAARSFHASRNQDVRLINGFPKPLNVELAGRTQRVPARGMIILPAVPVGRQQGRAVTDDGIEVDALELEVSSGLEVFAWNIAGAAPVYRETVAYGPRSSAPEPPDKPEIDCGRKVISLRSVDYAFREPPASMQLSKADGRITRTRIDVAPQEEGSNPLCLVVLLEENRTAEAAAFLEVSARMSGWEPEATARALRIVLMTDPGAALRMGRAAIQSRPEEVELHRLYQWVAERTGQQEALVEEYRARAEAQPDSATAQYLHARLMPWREGARAMEQLAQRFPTDRYVLRSVTYNRWLAGDWRGTLEAWERLRSLDASDASGLVEAEATALVALGRRGEALALLKKLFEEAGPMNRSRTAELYARVARTEKGVAPDELIAALEGGGSEEGSKQWLLRSRAELPTQGAPDWPGLRLMSAVGRDPQAVVELAARLESPDLQQLSDAGWALAYGEAVRTGATASEKVLAQAYVVDDASLELFRRFVRGEAVSLQDAELEPELRAAACFVRSRNKALPAEERRRLLEQARKEDWFHGSVSEAIASWAP